MFQSDPAQEARAVETVREQIKALQTGGVKEQEVDDSREALVGGLFLSLETNRGIAYLNREIEYHELGENYLQRFPIAVRAVSRERLIAAAAKWFHPDRYLLSVVQPLTDASGAGEQ